MEWQIGDEMSTCEVCGKTPKMTEVEGMKGLYVFKDLCRCDNKANRKARENVAKMIGEVEENMARERMRLPKRERHTHFGKQLKRFLGL